ncbi:hypothetical protein DYB30_000365 [Aphanomyces astaci]|uniref:GOLD domain-containing protein n=1 Tax=Aphanomyces astaci TaxID=112090 RepID=A0A397D1N2_APHAT|nr:hypothetical protein DYB38_000088 [Aphanomyces astaci]RHY76317.1 hypothetical protein DYB30_000365 [Aphanomyces astaci]
MLSTNGSVTANASVPEEAKALPKCIYDVMQLLDQVLRVEITDGRILVGLFHCLDKDKNLILTETTEYRYANNHVKQDDSPTPSVRSLGMTLIPVAAFITSVPASTRYCFNEEVKTKRTAQLRIAVLESYDPSDYGIRVTAFGPFLSSPSESQADMSFFDTIVNTPPKLSSTGAQTPSSGNSFSFNSEHRGGWYKFCVENTHTSFQKKVLFHTSYGLTTEGEWGKEDEVEAEMKQMHIKVVGQTLSNLGLLFDQIKFEQTYLAERNNRHFETLDSNSSRLFYWTLLQVLLVAVVYGTQSYFLKLWFSSNGLIGTTDRRWAMLGKAFVVVTAWLVGVSTALTVKVPGGQRECFIEHIKTKRTAYLELAVLESNDLYDIRLTAHGPYATTPSMTQKDMLFFDSLVTTASLDETSKNVQRNGFNFDTEHRGGWYKFCLGNEHSSKNGKKVDFSVRFGLTKEDELGHEDIAEASTKDMHIETVKASLAHLQDMFSSIQSEQTYYLQRDKRHSKTAEGNQSLVFWWTLVQVLLVAIVYGLQSHLMTRWFSGGGLLTSSGSSSSNSRRGLKRTQRSRFIALLYAPVRDP